MPAAAAAPIIAGVTAIGPKRTIEVSMWKGMRARSSASTRTTAFSPSLRSTAPSVVT